MISRQVRDTDTGTTKHGPDESVYERVASQSQAQMSHALDYDSVAWS